MTTIDAAPASMTDDHAVSDAPASPGRADELAAMAAGDSGTLARLMQSFTEVTARLEETHGALREQVSGLQRELADANERLRRSRSLAALGEMAAGIAHEVRNPLGSIALDIGMLGDDVGHDPESKRLCDRIAAAVSHLDHVVGDVLAFARDRSPRPALADPAALLAESIGHSEAALVESAIEVVTRVDDAAEFEVDPALAVQAFVNVIRNAAEAMRESERRVLEISVTRERRRLGDDGGRHACVLFAFEDGGPGVPAHIRDRVFNPFFTTRESGTGLGLAIVHRIVDAHGGALDIRDGAHGARVELCFPVRPSIEIEPGSGVSLVEAVADRVGGARQEAVRS